MPDEEQQVDQDEAGEGAARERQHQRRDHQPHGREQREPPSGRPCFGPAEQQQRVGDHEHPPQVVGVQAERRQELARFALVVDGDAGARHLVHHPFQIGESLAERVAVGEHARAVHRPLAIERHLAGDRERLHLDAAFLTVGESQPLPRVHRETTAWDLRPVHHFEDRILVEHLQHRFLRIE